MTLMRTLVACCVLLSAASILAGVGWAQTDAISGKWGSDSQTLLDLKFDGDDTVTGTAYFYMGESEGPYTSSIKSGTFDPKSGALKLEGDFKGPDDAVMQYVIEGRLENEALQMSFEIGDHEGSLTMKRIATA